METHGDWTSNESQGQPYKWNGHQDDQLKNLQDFQAKLETSIQSVRTMVESWIPKELRTDDDQPSPLTFDFGSSSRPPKNSRLGLGSTIQKSATGSLTATKLQHHLLKKNHDPRVDRGAPTKLEGSNQPVEEDEEEDSRTATINKKRQIPASHDSSSLLLLQPPLKVNKRSSTPPLPTSSEASPSLARPHPSLENGTLPRLAQDPTGVANLSLDEQSTPSSASTTSLNLIKNHPEEGLSKRQVKKLRRLQRARLLASNAPSRA